MFLPKGSPYTVPLTFSGGARTHDLASLSNRLEDVRDRVARALDRSGRPPGTARLVAVTKGVSAETVRDAMELGLTELGESRVQEAEGKIALVGPGPRWHLVGHLQTNKAKRAVSLFDQIHSVDSDRLARELSRRAGESSRRIGVYVEVNTSGDPQKHGVAPDGMLQLATLVSSLPDLRLEGLMTIGPLEGGPEGARASFRMLRRFRDEAAARGLFPGSGGLSMGMSDDFEIAVEEGATVLRVGSALFGPRDPEGARETPGSATV